jgi:hypothetical protein
MRYIFVLLFSAILIQPATALTIEVGSVSADYGKTVTVPITVSKAVHGLALSIETSGNIVKVKNRKFEALQRLKDAGKCDDAYELYRELLPIIKGK